MYSKHFAKIVGQRRIKETLFTALEAVSNGNGLLSSYLFTGGAGKGKSTLMKAYSDALAEILETESVAFETPLEFRESESAQQTLIYSALREVKPLVLQIDEFHDFAGKKGMVATKQTSAVYTVIKEALLDRAGKDRIISNASVSPDGPIYIGRKNFALIAGTNFPARLPDADAILRRFDEVLELDDYTEDDLTTIIHNMLSDRGIRGDERTIRRIARCGRGTCELPDKIVSKLEKIAQCAGKQTINQSEVFDALKGLQVYPRGLKVAEVKLINRVLEMPSRSTALALSLGIETKTVEKSVAYLSSLVDDKGRLCPFVHCKGSNIVATEIGRRYLNEIKELGFTW